MELKPSLFIHLMDNLGQIFSATWVEMLIPLAKSCKEEKAC
jgi:hypothetical protein